MANVSDVHIVRTFKYYYYYLGIIDGIFARDVWWLFSHSCQPCFGSKYTIDLGANGWDWDWDMYDMMHVYIYIFISLRGAVIVGICEFQLRIMRYGTADNILIHPCMWSMRTNRPFIDMAHIKTNEMMNRRRNSRSSQNKLPNIIFILDVLAFLRCCFFFLSFSSHNIGCKRMPIYAANNIYICLFLCLSVVCIWYRFGRWTRHTCSLHRYPRSTYMMCYVLCIYADMHRVWESTALGKRIAKAWQSKLIFPKLLFNLAM